MGPTYDPDLYEVPSRDLWCSQTSPIRWARSKSEGRRTWSGSERETGIPPGFAKANRLRRRRGGDWPAPEVTDVVAYVPLLPAPAKGDL
jgi:hypothetical protein